MLMTSRDANSHRWFSWDVFMDAYLHDPVNQRDFSNLFSSSYKSTLDMYQPSLLEDSSQLDLRILQRFSEAWAFSGKWRFSLLDGKLDIQEYNVYHNMGSWYLGVGAFVRKNGNKNEFGLGISFTIQQTGDYMPVKFL